MVARTLKVLRIGALVLGAVLLTILAVRIYDSQRGPDLQPWHTFVPDELNRKQLAKADWEAYLAAERAAFLRLQVDGLRRRQGGRVEDGLCGHGSGRRGGAAGDGHWTGDRLAFS
jgi:hypothetical protein